MARNPEAGQIERQNMRESEQKRGDWCVVGFCEEWENGLGLQGWNYESGQKADEVASELDSDPEFDHVEKHRALQKKAFEKLCEERGISYDFPSNW